MTTCNLMKKLALVVALCGLFAWQASANIQYGYVNFSLTGSGEVASGQLFGEINGGTMEVTSGYLAGPPGPFWATYRYTQTLLCLVLLLPRLVCLYTTTWRFPAL